TGPELVWRQHEVQRRVRLVELDAAGRDAVEEDEIPGLEHVLAAVVREPHTAVDRHHQKEALLGDAGHVLIGDVDSGRHRDGPSDRQRADRVDAKLRVETQRLARRELERRDVFRKQLLPVCRLRDVRSVLCRVRFENRRKLCNTPVSILAQNPCTGRGGAANGRGRGFGPLAPPDRLGQSFRTNVIFMFTRHSVILLLSTLTCCSLTQMPWMFSTVLDARSRPFRIASSKLCGDADESSMTFAMAMADSSCRMADANVRSKSCAKAFRRRERTGGHTTISFHRPRRNSATLAT